jgi:non-homologous end joining protein Ku
VRPIWSDTISFGLVGVPVRMFPTTESKELRFHFLDKKDLMPDPSQGGGPAEPAEEQEGEVVDLMSALRESVERTKKQRRAPSKRKAS